MKKTFIVKGMHCGACSMKIELELEDKVKKIKVDYSREKAEIDFDPERISEKEIREIIAKLGYEVK